MQVTIIPSDKKVSIDGRVFSNLEFRVPSNTHAVVWNGTSGEAQIHSTPGIIVENRPIHSLAPYQTAIDAWTAARDAEDALPVEPTESM